MKLLIILSGLVLTDTAMDAYLKIFPLTLILGAYVFCAFDIIFFTHIYKTLKKK